MNMECFLTSEGLLVRLNGLPTVEQIRACDVEACKLVDGLDAFSLRCEVRRLNRVPSSAHFHAFAKFLRDAEHRVTDIVVAHRGGRIVQASQRAFLRLYNTDKTVVFQRLSDDVAYKIYEDDEDFEMVDVPLDEE